MRPPQYLNLAFVLILALTMMKLTHFPAARNVPTADAGALVSQEIYLPLVVFPGEHQAAIMIAHTAADISKIPAYWLEQAKK